MTLAAVQAATVAAANESVRLILFEEDPVQVAFLAERLVADLAPLEPEVRRFAPGLGTELELVIPHRAFRSPADAFAVAHALETGYGVELVEPDLVAGVMPDDPETLPPAGEEGIEAATCWAPEDDRLAGKTDWALRALRLPEAWAWAKTNGRPACGAGIIIAQPDTGVTEHPELSDVTYAGQINLLENTPDRATDPLEPGNPGHGTATASVVVSGPRGRVSGAAPAALHLPIRAIRSVIRISQVTVAEAVDRAVEAGAAVITMSLGGIYSVALQRAIRRAVARDVIVLAAAGNCVRIVVWPARFGNVLAVGGTNFDDTNWRGSSRGPDVDVSAPAENVFRAVAAGGAGQGQGTSFAVALVAGVAACWLAAHGRGRVSAEARARGETVAAMFRRLVRATARVPAGWNDAAFGAGIVDAEALLKADFGQGFGGVESVGPRPLDSLRSLIEERFAPDLVEAADAFPWNRHAIELSHLLLAGVGGLESPGGARASPQLRRDLPPELAAAFGISPVASPESPALEAPALKSATEDSSPVVAVEVKQRQRRMIAAGALARDSTGGAESVAETALSDDADLPPVDDILARVEDVAARMPVDEIGDPDEFRRALETVYRLAESGIRKMAPQSTDMLTSNEASATEAVIRVDGSRPSLLVRDGFVALDHPMLGTWADAVSAHQIDIRKLTGAVGRIQPGGGHASRFCGTGVLVDAEKGLILTNYHVVEDARRRFRVSMDPAPDGRSLTVKGQLEVDFSGESTSLKTNLWKVVEVLLPDGAGSGFNGLDAAVLRLDIKDGGGNLPGDVPLLSACANYAQGGLNSLVTIGFPGPPPAETGTLGIVDWAWVTRTLFGNRFGFKRLAPGRYTQRLGADPRDRHGHAIGHDATTLGGASGSLLYAWGDPGAPAFGLHFYGTYTTEATEGVNHAISLAVVADRLRALGLTIKDDC